MVKTFNIRRHFDINSNGKSIGTIDMEITIKDKKHRATGNEQVSYVTMLPYI